MDDIDSNYAAHAGFAAAFEALGGDIEGRLLAQDYMSSSTAIYHDKVIAMGYLPKVYGLNALARFKQIAETTSGILEKLTQRFLEDAGYRELFGFSAAVEELIALPTGYTQAIPIMRVDVFFDEQTGDFMFCEFNTDGSSAMNEDREICNALSLTPSFSLAAQEVELAAQELFDPWVDAFLENYREWLEGAGCDVLPSDGPTVVAIVDYRESATLYELEEFRKRFEAAGCRCLVCDMPDLLFDGSSLLASDIQPGHPSHDKPCRVNAVYRRAVTPEVVAALAAAEEAGESGAGQAALPRGTPALIAAVREGAVCMQGGFRTQVAHSKAVFRMLHHPSTLAFLTDAEREFVSRHVPYTATLSREQLGLLPILEAKDDWIIKPIDGYGSVGVYAGKGFNDKEWRELVEGHLGGDYVVQAYCRQYAMPNTLPVPLDGAGRRLFANMEEAAALLENGGFDPLQLAGFNALTGLFVYNGSFAGVYMRAGCNPIIVGSQGGVTLGTLLAGYQAEQAQELGIAVRTKALGAAH